MVAGFGLVALACAEETPSFTRDVAPIFAHNCAGCHAANVTMGNGSYAMQSTWSNDTNECDISHPIISSGSGSKAFSLAPVRAA